MKWFVQITLRAPKEEMVSAYSEAQEMLYFFPDSVADAMHEWWRLNVKITGIDTKHRRGYSR
jgi:hypothetical protein